MKRKQSQIYMLKSVHSAIRNSIGSFPAETGGMLGMKDGIITNFYFDESKNVSFNMYLPDVDSCSNILNEDWFPKGINFCGFIHSHSFNPLPSESDKIYTEKLYLALSRSFDMTKIDLYIFIAIHTMDKNFKIHAYRVDFNNHVFNYKPVELVIY